MARTEAIAALAAMDVVLLDGIEALITADPISMDAALAAGDDVQARLAVSIEAVESATASYAVAAAEARTDPDPFLATCAKETP